MKNKVLTLVEGRKVNYRTVNDMREQTAKTGWGFSHVESIDREKVDKCNLRDCFSDYVIWRDLNGELLPVETARIFSWLDKNNIITMNTHMVGGRAYSSDKYYQHGLFGMDAELRNNTALVYNVKNKEDVKRLVRDGFLTYPLVLKERYGTSGKGIVLIPNEARLDVVEGSWNAIMAMPYIVADYDWRVFVVGGVAVGAMRKQLDHERPGDFVAKSAGVKEKVREEDPEVLREITRIACRMASVGGLEYAGCDIIRSKNSGRFYVLETNNSAGWQNRFNEVTGLNMGQILLEWFEDVSIAREGDFYNGVKTYCLNRIKYLYSDNREKFEKIMSWSDKTKQTSGDDLDAKLQNKYYEILHGGDVLSAKELIEEVERRPLSWAGSFLGDPIHGHDAIFEDRCIPTAYYLAIREKYDKIRKVN